MENTSKPRFAVLGSLLGALLLILAINAASNHLREGQEVLKQAAEIGQIVELAAGEASGQAEVGPPAAVAAGEGTEVEASDAVTISEAITTPEQMPASQGVTVSVGMTDTQSTADAEPPTDASSLAESETVTGTSSLTDTPDAGANLVDTLEQATTVGASSTITESAAPAGAGSLAAVAGQGSGQGGMGRNMGGGSSRTFHMTPIPDDYAGLLSPIPADDDSFARGEPIFVQNCAVCHGEIGLGDGPASIGLDPKPPMIAMTSQMLGDDYLFWRISEGGAFEPFNSAMPTWKALLDENARWDVINYVRSLGRGDGAGGAVPGTGLGRSAELEEALRAEMLSAGLEQGVITQGQADIFDTIHAHIDARRAAEPDRQFVGTMRDLQDQLLQELVADGTVEQEDADAFNEILALLEAAGLMQ